jgi:chaperonin GroES
MNKHLTIADVTKMYEYLKEKDIRRNRMKLRPMNDRLILEAIEDEDLTPGGLHIPSGSKDKPQRGKVLAVGPGAWHGLTESERDVRIPMGISVGDVVYFGRYSGTDITVGEDTYLVMHINDIIAVEE